MKAPFGGKGELELFLNRMLSRTFFAYLHLKELLEVHLRIHGRKNSFRAKLSQNFLIS